MSTQSLESFQSIEVYEVRQSSATQKAGETSETLLSKIVFATAVGAGFVTSAACFLYPVLMHMFYFEY